MLKLSGKKAASLQLTTPDVIIKRALSRNQVKLSFLLEIDCLIPDIIADVVS